MSRMRLLAGLACLAVGLCALAQPPTNTPPKLAVLVVFDQMRGDYLERWNDLFGDSGFRRLMTEGVWFTRCDYPYSATMTGPGHASMLTGCSPERHGIVMNDWYDRAVNDTVYCSSHERYDFVYSVPRPPPSEKELAKRKKLGAGTPDRLLAPTLGDSLKRVSPAARVVGLSLKDRGAILPTGEQADACYWFDSKTGTFCTSTRYRDRMPDWAARFNASKTSDRWFGTDWTRLRSDINYLPRSGPDDVVNEGLGVEKKQGRTFPHPMSGGLSAPGLAYYDTIVDSPFGNELLLDFARAAIEGEQLGQRNTPDLLTVSFSSNDYVGHMYGPDSQEVMDITLRADRIVRGLLEHLDRHVGVGNYILCMTADHGVCPMPELSRQRKLDAARVPGKKLVAELEAYMSDKYGVRADEKGSWFEATLPPWVYLNRRRLEARGIPPADAASDLAARLKQHPSCLHCFTAQEVAAIPADAADPLMRRVRKSFHPDRCGDVQIITKPYHVIHDYETGSTHGSPHVYDTRVPLLVFGRPVKSGRSEEPVTPQACAAILAQFLGVPPPAQCEPAVPARLREELP